MAVLGRRNATVERLSERLSTDDIPSVHFRDEAFDIFENNVKVITLNSAKGLEFPVVFLAHMDEGKLPRWIPMADAEEHELEIRNERRLFYVGLTRAAHRLYIVCTEGAASRFLAEIDPRTVRTVHYEGAPVASVAGMQA
jgi:DNA helicase-2/ATP-dependent DNA helicase PcrA